MLFSFEICINRFIYHAITFNNSAKAGANCKEYIFDWKSIFNRIFNDSWRTIITTYHLGTVLYIIRYQRLIMYPNILLLHKKSESKVIQSFLSQLEMVKDVKKENFTSKSNSNKIMLCGVGGNNILFWKRFQRYNYTS